MLKVFIINLVITILAVLYILMALVLQRSTNAVASPISVSKQVLTAITKITLTLPSAVTVTTGDLIKQDTSNAYGVVETGGTTTCSQT
jgi:hypothetical protein